MTDGDASAAEHEADGASDIAVGRGSDSRQSPGDRTLEVGALRGRQRAGGHAHVVHLVGGQGHDNNRLQSIAPMPTTASISTAATTSLPSSASVLLCGR